MSNKALVFDIQKFSVHDGPGIRTIVFMKGCPLHCEWCANPESQSFQPELLFYPDKCVGCGRCVEACDMGCFPKMENDEIRFDRSKCVNCCKCTEVCYAEARHQSGDWMTLDEIKEAVDKDLVFYRNSGGGITFSGGEAMCFPEVVRDLAKYYREEQKVSTAIETCGCVSWENYEQVIPYLDLVMYDLKCMNDERHMRYTGGSNKRILDNLGKISRLVNTIVRIPIIPSVNDSKEDIDAFGTYIRELGTIKTVHILAYHNYGMGKYAALGKHYQLKDLEAPSDEHMQEIKQQLEQYGVEVNIGG